MTQETSVIYNPIVILHTMSLFFDSSAVSMKPEHHVTVESEQDNPHGPELSPVDPSYIGKHVTVEKTKKGTMKVDPKDLEKL
jgi:hypothetical protein